MPEQAPDHGKRQPAGRRPAEAAGQALDWRGHRVRIARLVDGLDPLDALLAEATGEAA